MKLTLDHGETLVYGNIFRAAVKQTNGFFTITFQHPDDSFSEDIVLLQTKNQAVRDGKKYRVLFIEDAT